MGTASKDRLRRKGDGVGGSERDKHLLKATQPIESRPRTQTPFLLTPESMVKDTSLKHRGDN